jgi:hypothetical protein
MRVNDTVGWLVYGVVLDMLRHAQTRGPEEYHTRLDLRESQPYRSQPGEETQSYGDDEGGTASGGSGRSGTPLPILLMRGYCPLVALSSAEESA